jgi:hypothetical protein
VSDTRNFDKEFTKLAIKDSPPPSVSEQKALTDLHDYAEGEQALFEGFSYSDVPTTADLAKTAAELAASGGNSAAIADMRRFSGSAASGLNPTQHIHNKDASKHSSATGGASEGEGSSGSKGQSRGSSFG